MKPTTLFQKKVTDLTPLLSPITEKHENWGTKNLFECHGVISRNKHVCLECNHVWKFEIESKKVSCPNCNNKLSMFGENSIIFHQREYFTLIQRVKDLQVVRFIFSVKTMKKDKKPTYSYTEVMQHWINERGETVSLAKAVNGFSYYLDAWTLHSPMTIKLIPQETAKFKINPRKVYPVKTVLPILKRNGFKSGVFDIAPQVLFTNILKDSIAETLLKAGQTNLLAYYIYRSNKIKKNWKIIKICLKNNYDAVDWQIWEDYIDLLKEFGKDLFNSKLVCPANLKQAHDFYMNLKSDEKSMSDKELFEKYAKEKGKYFGLVFQENDIKISAIKTLGAFKKEGKALNHCLFKNKYFKKKDSLILSARINNKPIETIEISLSKMEINQCRGLNNEATSYNERILNLVNKNIYKIRRLSKQKQVA